MGTRKFKKGLELRAAPQATIVEEGHLSDPKGGDVNQTKNEYEDDWNSLGSNDLFSVSSA
jgi:hypothetical protein